MKILNSITSFLVSVKNWFLKKSLPLKILIIILVIAGGYFTFQRIGSSQTPKTTYQTAEVTKDTLIVSVTSSGQVASTNASTITTEASGVISKLYVKNGDSVKSGDPIAEIDLDLIGKQKSAQAYASYQNALNSVQSAQASSYSLQADMFSNWDSFKQLSETDIYKDSTSANRNAAEFHISEDKWLSSEAKYKNQQNVINQAQTSLTSSWYSYQQNSSVIYAPISGKVTGLSLAVGSVIANSNTSSGSTSDTSTSNKVASITTDAAPLLSFNLTEIDIGNVKVGDKATITLDALSNKTYTGKVISIDTVGTTSSGVTNYPVVIQLDNKVDGIYPNMSASAAIITQIKNDVLVVPLSAVQTLNGESTVRVLNRGNMESVLVQTGISNSTHIEIVSGLTEGEAVVTGTNTTSTSRTTTTGSSASPFGIGGFGGTRTGAGGNIRIIR